MRDSDKTETQRSLRAKVAPEERPSILWTHPQYGRVTAPEVRTVVGRAENCDVQLEGVKISREHAEVSPVGSALGIRDLGSRNGLWVNGQRADAAALVNGDVIRLGEWIGCVVPGLISDVSFGEVAPGLFSGSRLAAQAGGKGHAARDPRAHGHRQRARGACAPCLERAQRRLRRGELRGHPCGFG